LPVPVSPTTRTFIVVGATRDASWNTCFISGSITIAFGDTRDEVRGRVAARRCRARAAQTGSGGLDQRAGAVAVVGERGDADRAHREACGDDLGAGAIGLRQDDGDLLGTVLGGEVIAAEQPQHAVDMRDHGVGRSLEPQHREAERSLVAERALGLDVEAVLELADRRELAAARRRRRRDDHGDRAEADHVAGGDAARARHRRAIDVRAVAAAEVLDGDAVAAPAHGRVAARQRLVLDHDRAAGPPAEHDLGTVGECDDLRPSALDGDEQVPRRRTAAVDHGPQERRARGRRHADHCMMERMRWLVVGIAVALSG
jgi:hypothetical protein